MQRPVGDPPAGDVGQPLLNRLCDEIRYPCNLVVRDGRSIVYVAKVSPSTPLTSSVNVGTRLPAHATVLGRILLEDLGLAELRALYPEEQLEGFSQNTPKTVLELFNMVQVDRERGYVLGEGFFESSISTIAAPVRGEDGHIVAALGATIPSAHIDPELPRSVPGVACRVLDPRRKRLPFVLVVRKNAHRTKLIEEFREAVRELTPSRD